MAAIQAQIDQGAVLSHVSNVCPRGTKFWLLEVGWLECDEGYLTAGGNASRKSTEDCSFINKRREMPCYCILIAHPHEGLILWETGCGKDYPTVWGPTTSDVFARVRYEPRHELSAAIAATGHNIKDVKKVLIGHLHLDHAGGLDEFIGTDIEIWVHDSELKNAFWSAATGADSSVYLSHYLDLSLYVIDWILITFIYTPRNWKTFEEATLDFCQGITLHHLPGHTEGEWTEQVLITGLADANRLDWNADKHA